MEILTGGNESFKDLKLSWNLFIDNYQAFIKTEIFAFSAFFATILSGLAFLTSAIIIFPGSLTFESILLLIVFLVILGFNFLFYGFLSCQYGLSYDIMSSGDLFTEFRRLFNYFKRFWWQYSLITFLIYLPTLFSPVNTLLSNTIRIQGIESVIGPLNPFKILIYFFFEFLWFVVFIELYPSVTSRESLRTSIFENFTILKGNIGRLFTSIGLYYFFFKVPIIILYIISISSPWNQFTPLIEIINIINSIFVLISSLLGPPIVSLIATRIYVSVSH
ncbi:MAG: hypothetical protein ACXAC8_13520 [Candidatus Hodarchaeales archaeon]|jgi:hypothetical protein